MLYNPYTLWQIYITMRTIHGVYVTYSFFYWLMGNLWNTSIWFMSFIYNPDDIKQIEDKKDKNKLDEID
jgi:hypothetical protein